MSQQQRPCLEAGAKLSESGQQGVWGESDGKEAGAYRRNPEKLVMLGCMKQGVMSYD